MHLRGRRRPGVAAVGVVVGAVGGGGAGGGGRGGRRVGRVRGLRGGGGRALLEAQRVRARPPVLVQVGARLEGEAARPAGERALARVRAHVLLQHARLGARQPAVGARVPPRRLLRRPVALLGRLRRLLELLVQVAHLLLLLRLRGLVPLRRRHRLVAAVGRPRLRHHRLVVSLH